VFLKTRRDWAIICYGMHANPIEKSASIQINNDVLVGQLPSNTVPMWQLLASQKVIGYHHEVNRLMIVISLTKK
jgi:hypothetical protein